ncbi:MAG TPA: ATP-binding protein, partial [Pyrinomonadaceae bacterium]|nr:ATP-binding protein [Pyrinomonadaceae bacterium]
MPSYPGKAGTIITFYSYKGGTGRSMALANAACLLAKDGVGKTQRVLMIDWDLEAPGLYKFFPIETIDHKTQPGIINYFKTLQELLRGKPELRDQIVAAQGWKVLSKLLPIDEYIVSDVQPGIDLIPAGRFDSEYAMLVGSFNWVEFYDEFGWVINAFREVLTSKYKYSLIDSRTGLTDISGICTMLLPEKLVTVFTPNNQSLSGVIDLARVAVDYRRGSDDLRPLAIFPLPSRIDLAEKELREKWRRLYQTAFEDCFREAYDIEECDLTGYFDEVQLPQVSYYAYGENISVLREAGNEAFTLSRAYQVFLRRLMDLTYSWEIRSVAPAAVRQLRAPVGDFVGREQQIQTLTSALRQRGSRASITGISGMGGIGKTELALIVAEHLADDYPDGQFFINLQGTDANPLPPAAVLATCIRAFLGPDARLPHELQQLSHLYQGVLAEKRVLLLLDNAVDSAQVRPLLPPAGSALLVTSRQSITLPGMTPL